jgi:phospholipase/carboxylesterase
MVFDAIASGCWPVAAAITFAFRVTRPDLVAPPPGTKMLMVQSSADKAVPQGNSATGRTLLRRHGLDAHHLVCAGVGHEISPAATVYAARFIGSALRAKS